VCVLGHLTFLPASLVGRTGSCSRRTRSSATRSCSTYALQQCCLLFFSAVCPVPYLLSLLSCVGFCICVAVRCSLLDFPRCVHPCTLSTCSGMAFGSGRVSFACCLFAQVTPELLQRLERAYLRDKIGAETVQTVV
jgi:hypothetical protein